MPADASRDEDRVLEALDALQFHEVHRHDDGDCRAEQHHYLHHAGKGIDDERAVEGIDRADRCEHDEGGGAGENQQRQAGDQVNCRLGPKYADHQQRHGGNHQGNLRQRGCTVSNCEKIQHQRSPSIVQYKAAALAAPVVSIAALTWLTRLSTEAANISRMGAG